MYIKPRKCPICNSENHEKLYEQKFTAMSSGSLLDNYTVVICRKCGFGYADNIPEQEVFDAYYQNMSKYEYQEHSGQESPQDLIRFKSIVDILVPFLSPQSKVIEIGCATGKMLSLLKEKWGGEVMGVDPSLVCGETAERLYNISVYNYNLWDLPVPKEKFTCVILSAVLEHIRDLNRAIDKITSLLLLNGLLEIEVPDASRYAEFLGAPFQEFSTEHIDFFSPISLDNLLQKHGYQKLICEQSVRSQSDNTRMPVITAIYQYSGNKNHEVTFDNITKLNLNAYILSSQQIEKQLQQIIDNLINNQRSILVWGVGTHTQRLLATGNLLKANICAFIDSNPRYQDKTIHGISIIPPSELRQHKEAILISSQVFQSEIKKQIEEDLKLKNTLILLY
jgi:ubiquinone/menaquinone biosynthesis C-methylase UbiE